MPRRFLIAALCIALIVLVGPVHATRYAKVQFHGTDFFASSEVPKSALVIEPDFPSPRPPRKPHREVQATAAPTFPPAPAGSPWPHAPACCGPSAAEVRAMISATFGTRASAALAVADCESHDDWQAQNPYSGAAGVFQFIPGWWWDGAYKWNVWDAQANISMAFSASSGGTNWSAWSCGP